MLDSYAENEWGKLAVCRNSWVVVEGYGFKNSTKWSLFPFGLEYPDKSTKSPLDFIVPPVSGEIIFLKW